MSPASSPSSPSATGPRPSCSHMRQGSWRRATKTCSKVHECTHTISSRRMSSFDDFPMPAEFPVFPSHRQMLAYFTDYAGRFQLTPYIRLRARVERCALDTDGRWAVRVTSDGQATTETFDSVVVC